MATRRGDHQPATVPRSSRGAPLRRAILAGHRGDRDEAGALLGHTDALVRAAALSAVVRAAGADTATLAGAMADPHPAVRRRACVILGRALSVGATPRADAGHGQVVGSLVALLVAKLADNDASVVETAAWALGETGDRCSPAAVDGLVAVARAHTDPLCREAAVAALGAVGDARGMEAVFAALSDKAPVRRRAVIALAAFNDPGVEAAWRRHLDDRDWQVRQAAEDLLGQR